MQSEIHMLHHLGGIRSGVGEGPVKVRPAGSGFCIGVWLPADYQPRWEVCLLAFGFGGGEAALVFVEAWTVEQTRPSRGGFSHRRWVCFHGHWNSGHDPGRPMVYRRCLHLVHGDKCLLRLSSKPCGDGVSADLGTTATCFRRCRAAGDSRRFGLCRLQELQCNFFVF